MLQTWTSLTFLHWRYEAREIQPLLPRDVILDTFDGAAWVGLTPFMLRNLRPPFLPAMPWLSHFPETNVRTYVRGPDGERGVWFFTLEAARLAAVVGARLLYGLPYRWARMRVSRNGETLEYRSSRKMPFGPGHSDIAVQAGDAIEPNEFQLFVTARFRLYSLYAGRLAYAQIEHEPWPLVSGRVLRLDETLIERCGLPRPRGEPAVVHSRELNVRVERLRFAGAERNLRARYSASATALL